MIKMVDESIFRMPKAKTVRGKKVKKKKKKPRQEEKILTPHQFSKEGGAPLK